MGGRRFETAPKDDLIKTMARMVNSDSKTLSVIAENNKNNEEYLCL
ncbi:hypothetical protein [Marinicella pacifica]|jgi:hypothetical protein|nr:hypothetical protein [Marinicella pacifica]